MISRIKKTRSSGCVQRVVYTFSGSLDILPEKMMGDHHAEGLSDAATVCTIRRELQPLYLHSVSGGKTIYHYGSA